MGALQTVLARCVAGAAWRLGRADRLAAGTGLGPRSPTRRPPGRPVRGAGYDAAGPGLALIRDGNGMRSFETLLRYRGAARAEFWRALRTLKALQAEQAGAELPVAVPGPVLTRRGGSPARLPADRRPGPNEPERRRESRLSAIRVRPARPARAPPDTARARGALDAERTRSGAGGRVRRRQRDLHAWDPAGSRIATGQPTATRAGPVRPNFARRAFTSAGVRRSLSGRHPDHANRRGRRTWRR
jgi:hypothetical protein